MTGIEFNIFGKKFSVADDFAERASFKIKSAPFDYEVEYQSGEAFPVIEKELESGNLLFCDKGLFDLKKPFPKSESIFLGEATENFKTIDGVMEVWDFLRNNNFTKKEKLVVVGGGVIQDAAAFVGATYKRGILWHFFPTTLLAMCDSCIGAKSSINYKGAKNQLGLFSAPSKVIICEDFIKTLSPSDLSNGLGETLKLFLIGGERFLQLYKVTVSAGKVKEFGDYQKLILGALAIKKSVIEVDEFDLAYRKSLNFGHTFGHAVESLSDYQIPHGQAVAIGMLIANELSTNRGILAKEVNTEVKGMIFDLLSEKTRKVMETISMAEVGDLLLKDKKTLGKKLNLVILTEIGKTELLELPLSNELLQECSEIIHKNF